MSEDETKPKVPPPTDAERALAKKLGRALGRNVTGATASVSSRSITGSTVPVTSPPPPKSSDAPLSPRSEKEAVLAARRASVNPGDRRSIRPTSRAPAAKPKTRKSIIALGALLLLGALAAGGVYVKQALDARSPTGRVRNELLSWELAGAAAERDAAFTNLDQGAPATVLTAIELLTDVSRAERGDSNSQRTIQAVAHFYLVHYAGLVKAQPPKEAVDIGKKLFEGTPVTTDGWTAARDAWRAWVAEQQGKGSVPKS